MSGSRGYRAKRVHTLASAPHTTKLRSANLHKVAASLGMSVCNTESRLDRHSSREQILPLAAKSSLHIATTTMQLTFCDSCNSRFLVKSFRTAPPWHRTIRRSVDSFSLISSPPTISVESDTTTTSTDSEACVSPTPTAKALLHCTPSSGHLFSQCAKCFLRSFHIPVCAPSHREQPQRSRTRCKDGTRGILLCECVCVWQHCAQTAKATRLQRSGRYCVAA